MANLSAFVVLGGLLVVAGAARGQAVSLGGMVPYSAGMYSGPFDVAIADMDGDGKLDVVTANSIQSGISVLRGNGNGTFRPVIQNACPNDQLYRMAISDLNQDGLPDVAVVGYSGRVHVLLGAGAGALQAAVSYPTGFGTHCRNLTIADVNADGKSDLVVADTNNGTIGVLLGGGNGIFEPAVTYATGGASAPGIAVADVNGDGNMDLLVAGCMASGVGMAGVLLGNGNGTFQPIVAYTSGPPYYHLAVGDINGDGRVDMVTANYHADNVSILLGNSGGTFRLPITQPTGGGSKPLYVAMGDINADNKPDLITANWGNNSVGILLNAGNGTFQSALSFPVGPNINPSGIAIGDLNSDEKPDVVVGNWLYDNYNVGILLSTTPLPVRTALPEATASLAPNPAGAATTLRLAGLPATVVQVQAAVLDATGRETARQQLPARQRMAQAELPTAGLAPGLYVVRLLGLDAHGGLVGELPAQRLSVE